MEFGALRLLKPVSLAGIPYYLMQSVFFCYVIFSLDLSLNNQRTRFKSEKPAKPPICCVTFFTYKLIIIVIIINHHYQSNCQQFYPRKMGISFLIYQPSDQRRSFYDLDWDKTRLFLSCFDSQTFETRLLGWCNKSRLQAQNLNQSVSQGQRDAARSLFYAAWVTGHGN